MTATILAIETSTHACSVALQVGNDVLNRRELAARKHGELLLPWVQALLAEGGVSASQLDAVAVSRGPGAFTGVRMGIAVAQGLAMASDLPAIGLSSLLVCAHGGWRQTGLAKQLVAFDARMGELYWAECLVEAAGKARLLYESVTKPENVELPSLSDGEPPFLAVSDGWLAYPSLREQARSCLSDNEQALSWLPDATDLLALAQQQYAQKNYLAAPLLQPVYLRNNVAQKPKHIR